MCSYARVRVADQSGVVRAELEAGLGPVSWRLNKVGKAVIGLAKTDEKVTLNNLQFGNRVLIEFDNGLPNWGGVLDPPREWNDSHVMITAYSGEYLFGWRTTDKGRYFSGATVGGIFTTLVNEANNLYNLGVEVGDVWQGGDNHSPDYHFKNLLTIFQDSLTTRLSDADFEVTASESDGLISFMANLYESKGLDKSASVYLIEGHNLSQIRLVEQGPIANEWNLAGAGTTWGDDRITSYVYDGNSIGRYGLRQGSEIYNDVSQQTTLDAHADNALAIYKEPHNMLELEALDLAPAAFANYDVGDWVTVQLYSYGFGGLETPVRIYAREYDPATGRCKLVVREVGL